VLGQPFKLDYSTLPPESNLRCTHTPYGLRIEILPPGYWRKATEWLIVMLIIMGLFCAVLAYVVWPVPNPVGLLWVVLCAIAIAVGLGLLMAVFRSRKRAVFHVRRRELILFLPMFRGYRRYRWPAQDIHAIGVRQVDKLLGKPRYYMWLTTHARKRFPLGSGSQQETAWLTSVFGAILLDRLENERDQP
jgi:hypothetical protein